MNTLLLVLLGSLVKLHQGRAALGSFERTYGFNFPRDRITVLPGPPTIYQTLLDHPKRADYDLSSLRFAVTGIASYGSRPYRPRSPWPPPSRPGSQR